MRALAAALSLCALLAAPAAAGDVFGLPRSAEFGRPTGETVPRPLWGRDGFDDHAQCAGFLATALEVGSDAVGPQAKEGREAMRRALARHRREGAAMTAAQDFDAVVGTFIARRYHRPVLPGPANRPPSRWRIGSRIRQDSVWLPYCLFGAPRPTPETAPPLEIRVLFRGDGDCRSGDDREDWRYADHIRGAPMGRAPASSAEIHEFLGNCRVAE